MFTLPYVVATLIALSGSVEQCRLDDQIRASEQLKKGDGEARVLDVLGSPGLRIAHGAGFFSSGAGPPQWIYGTDVDLRAIVNPESTLPNLVPIKLRIFGPYQEDLVITWDDKGAVASIARPSANDKKY